MTTHALATSREGRATAVPPLEAGDHLNQRNFHERYRRMPDSFRAELIGGIVYVPSPLRARHGKCHSELIAWLTGYKAHTANTAVLDNATHILSDDSEPQPDASLIRVVGGQTRENAEGYIEGAPEFAAEVASSSESIDLHRKRDDYLQYGVQEYLVLVLRDDRAVWFVREGDRFVERPADADGILRSQTFPGLWLDAAALFRCDTARLLDVLQQGLSSPDHAAFVAKNSQR